MYTLYVTRDELKIYRRKEKNKRGANYSNKFVQDRDNDFG